MKEDLEKERLRRVMGVNCHQFRIRGKGLFSAIYFLLAFARSWSGEQINQVTFGAQHRILIRKYPGRKRQQDRSISKDPRKLQLKMIFGYKE